MNEQGMFQAITHLCIMHPTEVITGDVTKGAANLAHRLLGVIGLIHSRVDTVLWSER